MPQDSDWFYVGPDTLEEGIKELLHETRTLVHMVIDVCTQWLLEHSLAVELGFFESQRLHGGDRLELLAHALFQFLLSYTDWLCFLMFVYTTIYSPSLFVIMLTASVFCYALLVTPHRMYWEFTLSYVEVIVALKAFAMVMQTAGHGDATFPSLIVSFCSQVPPHHPPLNGPPAPQSPTAPSPTAHSPLYLCTLHTL